MLCVPKQIAKNRQTNPNHCRIFHSIAANLAMIVNNVLFFYKLWWHSVTFSFTLNFTHALSHHSILCFHGNRLATCQSVHPVLCHHLQLRRYWAIRHYSQAHPADSHLEIDGASQIVDTQGKLRYPGGKGGIEVQAILPDTYATISVDKSLQKTSSSGDEVHRTMAPSPLGPHLKCIRNTHVSLW